MKKKNKKITINMIAYLNKQTAYQIGDMLNTLGYVVSYRW
jgi:hypothetical protein